MNWLVNMHFYNTKKKKLSRKCLAIKFPSTYYCINFILNSRYILNSYLNIWLIVKILANYIICNRNRSYEACQKQFKLVDFLFQTRIFLERAKRMMLARSYSPWSSLDLFIE